MAWGDWKEKKVSILGTQYTVILDSDEEKYTGLKKADGYIDITVKQIIVKDKFETESDTMKNLDTVIKANLRHEIIHGFLYESGLDWNSHKVNAWAVEEEIVDFFALQFPKIVSVYNELGVL